MSDKPEPPKKGLEEPEAAYRHDDDALTDAEWTAWEERNKDALIASIREAREQIARGEYVTLEDAMARVRATIERVAKKP
jgi:hypothetical protein